MQKINIKKTGNKLRTTLSAMAIGLLSLTAVFNASAAQVQHHGFIGYIGIHDGLVSNAAFLTMTGVNLSLGECTIDQARIDTSNPVGMNMYNTLVAAKLANKKVFVAIQDLPCINGVFPRVVYAGIDN